MAPLLFSGFLYSMRTAAALVRNEIATVIAVMKRVTPADEEKWTSEVAEPALALHETLMTLSVGWGRGWVLLRAGRSGPAGSSWSWG